MASIEVPKMNTDMTKDDLNYDFNRLLSDPSAVDKIKQALAQADSERNTMTMGEFRKYEVLFRYSGINEIGEESYRDLAREYFRRINLYYPVTVTDGHSVVMRLPPIFNQFNMICDAGQTGTDVNQAWINANNSDDLMSRERQERYVRYYQQLINAVNDRQLHEQKEQEAKTMADKALLDIQDHREAKQQENEIQDIGPAHFNTDEIQSLSGGKTRIDSEDEFEPI